MTISYTALYGIAKADDLEPLGNYPAITGLVADTVEAALKRGGIATPTVASLTDEITARQNADTTLTNADTALSNRITALEPGTWVNLSLAAAFTAYAPASYGTPGYRVIGKRVHLRGWINNAGAVAGNAAVLTAALPAAVRPPLIATFWPVADGTPGAPRRFQIDNTGTMITNTALAAGLYLNLDGCGWMLA